MPEMFVGPEHELREREGFPLTDRRAGPRQAEQEIDYCLYCHERDKDSCSKGLRERGGRGALETNDVKAVSDLVGMTMHLPTSALWNLGDFTDRLLSGELEEPARDLLFRNPSRWE